LNHIKLYMENIWLCQGSSRVWGGEPGSYPAKPVPSAIDLVHRSCTGIYGRARNNAFRDLFIARRRGTNRYAYPYSYPFFSYPCTHTPFSYPCFIPLLFLYNTRLSHTSVFHTRFIPIIAFPFHTPLPRHVMSLLWLSVFIPCFHTLFSYHGFGTVFIHCFHTV